MKVVFCWSDISGYMAACWRALHACAGIDLFVLAFAPGSQFFSDSMMHGIPCRLLSVTERQDAQTIRSIVLEQKPDVVFITGWFHKPYRALVFDPAFDSMRFVMGMDTPWRGTVKQHLARFGLRRYLDRMDLVAVTGERSYQYARRLSVASERIMYGMYGIDYTAWAAVGRQRNLTVWPKSFLFTGRYAEEKAIDVLAAAYQAYRSSMAEPWPLLCCGSGLLQHLLHNAPGIEDMGFVQPADLWSLYCQAGAFLLPSRFDPWPLALVEAAAAGLPIVCTSACGSAVEVVRDGYNGLVIPENNSEALASAMSTIHSLYEQLPLWGERSTLLAQPYAANLWAECWAARIYALVDGRRNV